MKENETTVVTDKKEDNSISNVLFDLPFERAEEIMNSVNLNFTLVGAGILECKTYTDVYEKCFKSVVNNETEEEWSYVLFGQFLANN